MSFLFSQPAPGILPANSVDFSEVETIASNTLLGNNTGSDSVILELSKTQATAMLDVMGAASAGSGGLKGLVPASSAGDQTKFLRADATWNTIDLSGLQPLDSDLTAIAGLTPADDDIIQRKAGAWTNRTPAQFKTDLSLTKSDVGLSNVDNTSDANKPISTATQSALNAKVDSVSGSSPISSSGGTTPTISISDFGGATSLLPGSRGSVPAPAAGDQAKFLRGDASWQTISTLPSQTSNLDKVLATDGTNASWQYAGLGSGSFGSGNTILGRNKPASLTGTDDVVIGVNAGNAMTTSIANVFIGKDCAKLTTSAGGSGGSGIVAIGTNCFSSATGSTSGSGCVFIGNDAATNASVGPWAVAIGSIAGNNALIPQYAVLIGHRSTGTGASPLCIGTSTNAGTYNNCTVLGNSASASGNSAIALGANCSAGLETFAIGSTTAQIRTLQLGIGGNTNTGTMPLSVTITPTRVSGGWTNLSGASGTLIITGTNSTGFTPGSDILFQTCPTGTTSSTTVNSVVERFRIKADTEVAVNDTGVDFDFRVEGDTDANLLFVDAGTDRVGVGNNAPAVKLHTQATTAATNTVTNVLRVDSQSSGTPATGIGVGIEMAAETAAGNTEIGVVLEAVTTDVTSTSEDFDLVVKNMAAGATAAETLRVASTGDITAKTGNILIDTAGKGLAIKSGSNAKIGTATFTAQGTVTVNTTAVTANSLIFVTGQDGTDAFCVGNKVNGTSFDIVHSTGNVTAVVAWMIVEATP